MALLLPSKIYTLGDYYRRPCEAFCVAVDYASLRNSIKEYREKYTY